jgi:hypothetical protein
MRRVWCVVQEGLKKVMTISPPALGSSSFPSTTHDLSPPPMTSTTTSSAASCNNSNILVVVGIDGIDGETPWYSDKIKGEQQISEQLQRNGGQWVTFDWAHGTRVSEFSEVLANGHFAMCLFADTMNLCEQEAAGEHSDSDGDSDDNDNDDAGSDSDDDGAGGNAGTDDVEDEKMFASLTSAPASEALVRFASAGASVVFCGGGVPDVVLPVIRRVFGLTHWKNGQFNAATFTPTAAASGWLGGLSSTALPESIYAALVSVQCVPTEQQLYIDVATSTDDGAALVLAAAASVGSGRVVFIGDVNGESGTCRLVASIYQHACTAVSQAVATAAAR